MGGNEVDQRSRRLRVYTWLAINANTYVSKITIWHPLLSLGLELFNYYIIGVSISIQYKNKYNYQQQQKYKKKN